MATKRCYGCKTQKPLTEFHKHPTNKDRLQTDCKDCRRHRSREYQRRHRAEASARTVAWYKANPEKAAKHRATRGLKKYGLTAESFTAMLIDQGSCCEICKKSLAVRKEQHIDHCHMTGQVRGILCHGCNMGLGHFGDDVGRLLAAANYLAAAGAAASEHANAFAEHLTAAGGAFDGAGPTAATSEESPTVNDARLGLARGTGGRRRGIRRQAGKSDNHQASKHKATHTELLSPHCQDHSSPRVRSSGPGLATKTHPRRTRKNARRKSSSARDRRSQ